MTRRAVLLAGLAVAACSGGHVRTAQTALTGALPRPAQVVVTDFAITPDEVKLDRGVGVSVMRNASGQPASEAQMKAAQATQSALSETLVAQLRAEGLPAVRVAPGAVPPPGTLLVQGQILGVDQGNRARRLLIGLGAGKSQVQADSQLYYIADPSQPQFLRAFTGSADSGRMPGAAETMGAGAAAQTVGSSAAVTTATHTNAEARHTDAEAEADALAKALAHQIGTYAAAQGWIAASAVK